MSVLDFEVGSNTVASGRAEAPAATAEQAASGRGGVPGRCVHRELEAQAGRTPGAVAVTSAAGSLTYRELHERANRLARQLRRCGVGPEARVAIRMERSPEMVVAIVAVLKAGGAYVPIDPAYPAERAEWIVADAGARVLLTQSRLAGALTPRGGVRVLGVDAQWPEIAADGAEPLDGGAGPRNLAYVIYTSGSTGTPKGVGVEHEQVCAYLAWAAEAYPGSRSAVHSSLSFDLTVTSLFVPLLRGGTVELVDEAGAVEALAARLAAGAGYGMLKLTPSHLRVLGETLDGEDGAPVECLVVGGEALLGEDLEPWRRRFPRATVVNEYGPTETVVGCCIHVLPLAEVEPGPVPIGRAAPGVALHVLDAGLRPVPAGEAGELYVGGAQVTRGYLGRPALTAERFVPDPLGAPGGRMYRTGDQARALAGGALGYLGRLDGQVKIRGYRIEPGEVEEAVRRTPGVKDGVVLVREDAPGERRLVAYVTGSARPAEVRAALRRALPDHMVPAAVVALGALPLTANGKVDRRALPAPEAGGGPVTAPRTEVEAALERIWCEVLGVERVGIDRDFLELGGHSLPAMRVLARIRDAFAVDVGLQRLLAGSIAQIAEVVEHARGTALPAPKLERVSRDGPLPLAYSQEAAWFFEQLSPGVMAYRAQSTIRVRGALRVDALEGALSAVLRRHEIFRTTTPVENGGPVQRIHAPWRVRVPVYDVSDVAEEGRMAAAREIVEREFRRPFDTSALPLVYWSLVRLDAGDHLFIVVEHHFVHDGWSFGVFLRDLRAAYLAELEGRPADLPEPAVQFADYAAWQRRWMASPAAEAKLRYWEEELAGVPTLALPTDRPRPAAIRFHGASERVRIPPALADAARAFGREHGTTFFVTLMAAFQALMGRYSGQRDFCVGSALGNRVDVALDEVIGMVVNSVAIRSGLDGDPTGAQLVRRVRDTTLRAHDHQEVPFDQVVRRVSPERSTDVLPLIQASFSFHDSPMTEMQFGGLTLELEEAQSNGSAKFDLQVIVIPRAEQGMAGLEEEVVAIWEFNTDLFDRATIRRMVGHFETLLEGIVRHPDRRVSQLELLGPGERARVVEGWNNTAAPAPAACIHHLLEAQARRTPGADALVCDDETLSYRELDERANRLARHLARFGAGPETRVGICLERSAAMVVAMLAVLKAGAAYLPLDPAYPADRLAYMMDDAGAALLVTSEALRGLVPTRDAAVVLVDAHAGRIAAEPGDAFASPAAPANAAYVIYTSGSTGRPKGVVVTHANAAAFLAAMDERISAEAPGTWLAVTRIGFDIHVLELLWTLSRGFRVVVHPGVEQAREDGALARRIRQHGVTHLQCTPTLAAMVVAESGVDALAGLDRLFLGGEALPGDLAARLTAALPGRVVNLYGPTETTVWSTTHAVAGSESRVPIGRPIANTRVYVMDGALHAQPEGVPGELCIGGAGVTRGYLARPGLTAERFIPDPFAAVPGARMYRTGDRARWRADGVLAFMGRLDQQVKIRGFRVEPGEIEAALRTHPAVRDCAVVSRQGAGGETRLAAYVVWAGDPARPAELRAHLGATLPEYMVPAWFTPLGALPLLPNGKLDRRALPEPESAAEEEGYAAPAEGPEAGIARIWGEILGHERVGTRDDFFALGGDSLLATRVVMRTRAFLGRDVPLVSLFDHRTLGAFASAAVASPVTVADDDDDLFAGAGREAAWG